MKIYEGKLVSKEAKIEGENGWQIKRTREYEK